MGSFGCLAKGDIFFWQNILKNRSKYRGDISEQSVVCTALISAIIIEIFRKNIPVSYIIPYKKLASPLIPVCLRKSHMNVDKKEMIRNRYNPIPHPVLNLNGKGTRTTKMTLNKNNTKQKRQLFPSRWPQGYLK